MGLATSAAINTTAAAEIINAILKFAITKPIQATAASPAIGSEALFTNCANRTLLAKASGLFPLINRPCSADHFPGFFPSISLPLYTA